MDQDLEADLKLTYSHILSGLIDSFTSFCWIILKFETHETKTNIIDTLTHSYKLY